MFLEIACAFEAGKIFVLTFHLKLDILDFQMIMPCLAVLLKYATIYM